MPQDIDFEEMKFRAKVYARLHLIYRIRHLAIFTEKFTDEFLWDMSEPTVRLVAGMAEWQHNSDAETEKAFLDFLYDFYSCEPDENGVLIHLRTDEALDFPEERQQEIRAFFRSELESNLEFEKKVEGDEQTFEACMRHLNAKPEDGLKITVVGYPCTFSFMTHEVLPDFSYGCPVRGELLHRKMEELGIESPSHAYTDYVVEFVDKEGSMEYWHLGS